MARCTNMRGRAAIRFRRLGARRVLRRDQRRIRIRSRRHEPDVVVSSGAYVAKLTGSRVAPRVLRQQSGFTWIGTKVGFGRSPTPPTRRSCRPGPPSRSDRSRLKTTGKLEYGQGTSPPKRLMRGTSTLTLATGTPYFIMIEIKVLAATCRLWVNGGLEISDTTQQKPTEETLASGGAANVGRPSPDGLT